MSCGGLELGRLINGTLWVENFSQVDSTTFSFTDATYNNQADPTGSGSYDVTSGFILFVPSVSAIDFSPLPGVAHRFKLVSIQDADGVHLSATMQWDEDGTSATDYPMDETWCIISEDTTNCRYGLPSSRDVYSQLGGGISEASYNADIRHITDKLCCSITGAQGQTGVPGVTGLQGPQGDTGVQGLQGVTGIQGIQGETGVGVTGV